MIPKPPRFRSIKVQENGKRGPHQPASMSAHNHTEFILPGDRNPLAVLQAISAILLALDMVYNRRRLEAMVHALRNAHLISLVADRSDLVVVPQMVIYYTDDPDEPLSSSLSTQPEQNAKSVTPDFCVLHLPFHERFPTPGAPFNPTSILDWRKFQLDSAFIPIIEEDKRPISRGELSMETIRIALAQSLERGCHDAEYYASFLWKDPRRAKQKRVILISSVGLWWRFMLAERPAGEYPGSDAEESVSSDSSESWEEEGDRERVKERTDARDGAVAEDDPLEPTDTMTVAELTCKSDLKRKAVDSPDDNRDEKRTRKVSPNRDAKEKNVPKFRSIDIIDVDPAPDAEDHPAFDQIQEVVVDNVQDAWPEKDDWSGLIHLGTPASNQRLWLIHDWLQKFSNDPECVDLDLQDIA